MRVGVCQEHLEPDRRTMLLILACVDLEKRSLFFSSLLIVIGVT